MLSALRGFTLIELLVVIAIMAVTGVFVLANYRSFGEDQNLKNAALDIQSLLRLAQANSTSGLQCQGQAASGWLVEFTNSKNLNLKCSNSSGMSASVKTLTLKENISIDSISMGATNCVFSTTTTFAPIYGTMTSSCGAGSITLTVKNTRSSTKQVIIDRGGRVYGQ